FAGSMGLAADVISILRAAEICQRKGIGVEFTFLGDGDRKAEYVAYCERQEIKNCSFLDPVPREDLDRHLRQAWMCVHALPANPFWRCALPSKVLDYLAAGRPVVYGGEGDAVELLGQAGGG